MGIAWNPYTT
jgi:adenylosuccinate lyase